MCKKREAYLEIPKKNNIKLAKEHRFEVISYCIVSASIHNKKKCQHEAENSQTKKYTNLNTTQQKKTKKKQRQLYFITE
jgi:hypothetical protein